VASVATIDPVSDFGTAIIRLTAATLVGGAIGLNRELHDKPAGVRTHALVGLGAALATFISIEVTSEGTIADMGAVTRVIQGVLTGIGFLGAGVIFRDTGGKRVKGLTTAATIWVVACLGMACGAGRMRTVLVAVIITIGVLVLGGPIEQTLHRLILPKNDNASDTPDEPSSSPKPST
jgi:putative Mg2+ transporter-C (MgtC) family protein